MKTTRRVFLGLLSCLPLGWLVKPGAPATPGAMGLAALIGSMPKGTVIAHRTTVSYPFWRNMPDGGHDHDAWLTAMADATHMHTSYADAQPMGRVLVPGGQKQR